MKFKVFDSGYRGNCVKENAEQKQVFAWLKVNYPEVIAFSVPNENQHRMVQYGVISGVPDIIVLYKGHTGFFEMKRKDKTKSRLSQKQTCMLEKLAEHGYYSCVCYGYEQFKIAFEDFMGRI